MWVILLTLSLMEATYNGHLECVQLLVNHGASWSNCDQSGTVQPKFFFLQSCVLQNVESLEHTSYCIMPCRNVCTALGSGWWTWRNCPLCTQRRCWGMCWAFASTCTCTCIYRESLSMTLCYFYRQMMYLKTQLVCTLHFSRLVGIVYS